MTAKSRSMQMTVSTVALSAVVLAVVIFASALAVAALQLAQAGVHSNLQRQAAVVAASIDAAAGPTDAPELPLPVAPATELALYGLDGRRIAGNGPATLSQTQLTGAAPGQLVNTVPVGSAESATGRIRISAPQSSAVQAAAPWWIAIAATAAFCVAVGWGAASLIARRVARPLAGAADAARSLGAGDLAVRAPLSGIAEVDAVASELNRSSAALSDLLSRERAIATVASHQLRTPLAAARARLERAALDPDAELLSEVELSLRDLDHLSNTIDEVIALHRGSPLGEPLDANAFQRALTEKWTGSFAAAGRPLRMTIEKPLPRVAAPRAALAQIVDVLLDNTLSHGEGSTDVAVRAVQNAVAIDVRDQGRFKRDEAERLLDVGPEDAHIGLRLATRVATENGFRLLLTNANPTTMTILIPGADRDERGGPQVGATGTS